jgi:hypothetical protein
MPYEIKSIYGLDKESEATEDGKVAAADDMD